MLILIAAIPAIEVVLRRFFRTGLHGATEYVQHGVIWVTFLGGMITSREGRHLALTAGIDLIRQPLRNWVRAITSFVAVSIGVCLTVSAWKFVSMAFMPGDLVGILPIRGVMAIMPVGLAVMTLRFVGRAPRGLRYKLVAASALILMPLLLAVVDTFPSGLTTPLVVALVAAGLLGMPVFVVLAGMAALLFARSGGAQAVIPNEAYTMLSGPMIPTIPLFALTGFILSESKAGERLVRFFQATFGWLPGGLAIVAVVVCAFFTTFTGASGVTILALGSLLAYVLSERGYEQQFGTGLLTASGSIGLLFPPSLPIILYGVIAHVNIKHLFVAGLLPGALMVVALGGLGVRHAFSRKVERIPLRIRDIGSTFTAAAWELALPLIILLLYLKGLTTLVETGAIAVVYTLFVSLAVRRDVSLKRLPQVMTACLSTIGGVLIILAFSRGLSYYIVDMEIPVKLTQWCAEHIHSKYVFLALLNLGLLLTGCFMDIFSAIVVVVPLIIPLGQAFDVNPIHLGIIFLANLELGYLTPPVGINLFLASYRFEQPLTRTYRQVLPFLLALLVAVLLITYVPWLTMVLPKLLMGVQ